MSLKFCDHRQPLECIEFAVDGSDYCPRHAGELSDPPPIRIVADTPIVFADPYRFLADTQARHRERRATRVDARRRLKAMRPLGAEA